MEYLLERYGRDGSCYQDPRVIETADNGPDHIGDMSLLDLLRTVHDEWHRKHGDANGNSTFCHNVGHALLTNIQLVWQSSTM